MDFTTDKRFDFVSNASAPDTFGVVSFRGTEGFSRCYEFEITLVATDPEIDLDAVLENSATFTILREAGDIPFHGILSRFEQLQAMDRYVFYRAVLVPKLWWLSLTHHNQVFLNKTTPEIIEQVLKDGGLSVLDFEFRLQKNYLKWEYVCQYRESHLAFVSRWMERDGIYFFFEQSDSGEKVIITDSRIAHIEMPQGKTMYYRSPSGLDDAHREEVIHAFVCRQQQLPKTVRLRDYNYRTPSLEITGTAAVKPTGRGDVYIYGEHFRTPEEGDALAKVRAEELLCRGKLFYGESTIPYLRTGYLFGLQDHYRNSYNDAYLTIEIAHQGSQTAFLIAGIQKGLSDTEIETYYRNSFISIPAHVQFRAERRTEKARFYGSMNAKIDAAGSGQYAELDDQGRYKVILPFDLSGRKNGKASTYLRMAQPYAGTDHGMHFPLHRGTEVLLTFIDGDPDRPIIAAAVPNPEHPSLVTSKDQTMSKITTGGGNRIHIEDQQGKQRILLHSPTENSFVRVGAENDPPSAGGFFSEDGINISTDKRFSVNAQIKNQMILGENGLFVIGNDTKFVGLTRIDSTIGMRMDLKVGGSADFSPMHKVLHGSSLEVKGQITKLTEQTTEMVGEVTKMVGENTRMIGANTRMIGEHNMMIGEMVKISGEENYVAGETMKMVGEEIKMRGQQTQMAGERTSMTGEDISFSGSRTRMVGQSLKIAGDETRMAAEETNLCADSTEITGLKLII